MSGRSPEIELLVMACTENLSAHQQQRLAQFLEQQPINWDRLYQLATRHRIGPFVYRALQQVQAIPENFLIALQNDSRAAAADNMLKLHEFSQLKKLFAAHKISYVAMKGVYLAENSYPESSLRHIGDFDILVARTDLFKTIQLLESNQYRLGEKYKHYLQYQEKTILADLHEVSLFKPFFSTSYFNIDLHWEIECFNKHYSTLHLEDIHSDPDYIIENQLILLVIHHGIINIWQHIGYVNDLYFLLKGKPVNWDYLMKKLEFYRFETVFLVGIYWCRQIWQLSLPPAIEALIATDRIPALAASYEENWEQPESVLEASPGLKQIAFFAKSQTNLSPKLRIYRTYVSSFVFRASTFMLGKRLVYIPKELGFITVLTRAIRSVIAS
ncbi:nucleotidyltransferase family protein [Spirosoma sp. KNUC1025]|uniref:nucleotidyltransferase domain-containing protein n=1 Tax=Spirosoma sp. KNUC1025 TaxID=2894082 RepID=UPI003863DF32|nr:nucleotidyltransferase family protein [Spirosoma sp. KNUC1025]